MKTEKLQKLLVSSLFFLFALSLPTVAKDDTNIKYDVTTAGVSSEGMTLVNISVYVENPKQATVEYLKKAAVHAIIFRGVAESSVTGFSKQRPLVSSPSAAQQYGDFFDSFFQKNGQYIAYANMVGSNIKTVKVDKKEYRVTATMKISTDELKKLLKDAGIVRGMTDGF